AVFSDNTGSIELIWFKGIKWIKPLIEKSGEFILYGKVTRYGPRYNIAHPEIELHNPNAEHFAGLQPVYSSSEKLATVGLNYKGIEKVMRNLLLLSKDKIEETLSEDIITKYYLLDREIALNEIHFPTN